MLFQSCLQFVECIFHHFAQNSKQLQNNHKNEKISCITKTQPTEKQTNNVYVTKLFEAFANRLVF